MSDIEIIFSHSVPDEIKPRLRKLLKPHERVLAREVRVLRVDLVSDVEVDGEAGTLPVRRYHWASICLKPEFFALEPEIQERTMAHEVVHVIHDIFAREVIHVIAHLVPDALKGYVWDRLEDAEERVVDALGDMIWEARQE